MSEHDDGYDPYNSATTRKLPAVPEWLRNDPEIEAAAVRVIMDRWRRHNLAIVRTWRGAGVQVQNLARYRK